MTDSSANLVNKYSYDEFGNLLNSVDPVPNPFLYVGQYGVTDEDNGLLYMRARYYDAESGRFIGKDPLGIEGGLNLYDYVENSPTSFIDPTGLSSWTDVFPGFGDTITFGGTGLIRQLLSCDDVVDSSCSWYKGGEVGGYAWWAAFNVVGFKTGCEFKIGKAIRIGPWGNRTGNPYGKLPHYHRRIIGPNGKTCPGGSPRWHRPWEKGW